MDNKQIRKERQRLCRRAPLFPLTRFPIEPFLAATAL